MTSRSRLKPNVFYSIFRWSSTGKPHKNPYDTLGLSPNATPTEVRETFFRLAKQLHPDVNPDDPDAKRKFGEVREAYQILKDERSRIRYDSKGEDNAEKSNKRAAERRQMKDYEVYMESKKRFYPNRAWSERKIHHFRGKDASRPYNYRKDYMFDRPDEDSFLYRNFGGPAPGPKEINSMFGRLFVVTSIVVVISLLGNAYITKDNET